MHISFITHRHICFDQCKYLCLFLGAMTEAAAALSYAKIVNPAVEAMEEQVEVAEEVEVAAKHREEEQEDDEGFQEVTNKKAEKARGSGRGCRRTSGAGRRTA